MFNVFSWFWRNRNISGIKVLHIAEVTGQEVVREGMKKVGLLGTRFTMEGDFYKKSFKRKKYI